MLLMDPMRSAPLLERLPYSIAAPLLLMEQGTSGMQRLHLLIHAYQHVIRFLAVCLLCDYLRHPEAACAAGRGDAGWIATPIAGPLGQSPAGSPAPLLPPGGEAVPPRMARVPGGTHTRDLRAVPESRLRCTAYCPSAPGCLPRAAQRARAWRSAPRRRGGIPAVHTLSRAPHGAPPPDAFFAGCRALSPDASAA